MGRRGAAVGLVAAAVVVEGAALARVTKAAISESLINICAVERVEWVMEGRRGRVN